ncbi:DUF4424 domain-containing protein [Microbaculum marinum]|uniref:DUF4424 domain-containing protein n=1 Tax=Microbaculum marinum TaxID=1764581 RepID=A0AAW9S0U9_9HYPH
MKQAASHAIAVAVLAGSITGSAVANDSSAVLGAGSITLVPNFDIVIDREDLYLSPDEVGVRYVIRNTTEEPIRLLVAFPLPDIDMQELFEVPIDLPSADSDNFVNFEVAVNGTPVEPSVERRAYSQGIDRTELLAGHGIPLNPYSDEAYEILGSLDAETRAEFERLGIGHAFEPHDPLMPFWTLTTVFYWEQEFAPLSETIVEHRYRPVVGTSFFGTYILDQEDIEGRLEEYCIDDSTQAGIRKRLAETGADYLLEHRLDYILTTARNWQGPIGTFRMIVDKKDPAWLVSLCLDGLKKTGPTQFEYEATDYVPQKDLSILFLAPPPQ